MSNKLSLLVNFVAVDKMSASLRNIVGLGRKGSQSLNELRGSGKKLESQLRTVRRELAGSSGNVTALIDKERDLEAQIEKTNRQLERRQRLHAIEADHARMVRKGDDLRARGREHITEGAALAAPLIAATVAAAKFSSGMVDIQQKAELSDDAADRLSRRVVLMANRAKQMPEDIRSGLDILLAKGMGLAEAEAAIGPAGRIATAYKVEIPDAADAANASINNLRISASQTAQIFDAMAAAGNAGGFEVADMARHFPALTAQFAALGEKGVPAVADLSAALQVAMHTAGGADQAANNIQNLLGKINAPGTINAFRKNFGIDLPAAMKKLEDQGYSSLEAIALVTKQATGGDMKKLGFAFEDQQARMGILAMIQNLDEYRQIRTAAMNSKGTVDLAFDQRVSRDASVSWTALLGSVSGLAITLGTTLLPVMSETMALLNGVADRVSVWAQANPTAAATVIKLVAGVAAFKIGLGAATLALGWMLGPLGAGIALWQKYRLLGSVALLFPKVAAGAKLAGVAFRFMLGPVGLAITLLGLLAYAAYTNWDKITGTFDSGLAWIRTKLGAMPNWMKGIGKAMMDGLLISISPLALAAKLIQMAKHGITAFKNYLGIKSPSRVFMALGRHTTDGLALGIDRGGQRAVGAMGKLAAGVTAAGAMALSPVGAAAGQASRPATAAQTTAAPITINIYQQPGEDAEALARRIKQILDRMNATAARGRYDDMGD